MVKIQQTPGPERMDELLRQLCDKYGFALFVEGRARKTYDVFLDQGRGAKKTHLARVESLAATNGEIRFFDDRAGDFVQEFAETLEKELDVGEATLIREKPPTADAIASPPMAAHLRYLSGKLEGRTVDIMRSDFVIGRGDECDLRIDDDNVSREHVRIV
jgi:hypothetical protein